MTVRIEFDRKALFDDLRPMFGGFVQEQVDGIDGMLDYYEQLINELPGTVDARHMAYHMATTYHETGRRMVPVRETHASSDEQAIRRLENAWQAGKLPWVRTPYWRPNASGQAYFGRGRVQLTHEVNYSKQGTKHGLPLVERPELMLESATDMLVGWHGMLDGDFRPPHSLVRYFNDRVDDPVNAREIINADKKRVPKGQTRTLGEIIAGYHRNFLGAIEGSLRQVDGVEPPPRPPSIEEALAQATTNQLIAELLKRDKIVGELAIRRTLN